KLVGKETDIIYNDGTNREQAKKLAQECDYVIALCGYQFDDEGEFIRPRKSSRINDMLEMNSGGDRRNLSLHDEDIELLKTMGNANKNTVAVIIAGSAVIMEEWKDDVSSIVMSFYSGSEGGNALANILFGKVNPSGKIPFTIAKRAEDYPFFDIDAKEITYDLFHGYSYFEKNNYEPAFAFGFGLSYTQFEYSDVKVEEHEDFYDVHVKVKNIGKRAGSEVVQIYIGAQGSIVERQKKLLAGFEKYEISIDEKITAKIKVDKQQLKYYDVATKSWVLEDCMYTIYAGSSSRDEDLLSCRCSISFNKTKAGEIE
ncbi:MAG: glycoside hydrolase family 3 C-terminal domain-containing protein, partial [Deltaproteobacteria bacterium]|nr:glycoside hydrolase family 3 C-terminal domain-containing protein [Deltaproteobacteria bacterium]